MLQGTCKDNTLRTATIEHLYYHFSCPALWAHLVAGRPCQPKWSAKCVETIYPPGITLTCKLLMAWAPVIMSASSMSMCPAISAKGNNGYVETIYLCAWYDCNECPSNRQSWFLAKVAVSGNNNTFFLHMSYLVSQITNYKLLTFFFFPVLAFLGHEGDFTPLVTGHASTKWKCTLKTGVWYVWNLHLHWSESLICTKWVPGRKELDTKPLEQKAMHARLYYTLLMACQKLDIDNPMTCEIETEQWSQVKLKSGRSNLWHQAKQKRQQCTILLACICNRKPLTLWGSTVLDSKLNEVKCNRKAQMWKKPWQQEKHARL